MKNAQYRLFRESLIPKAEEYANVKTKGYVRPRSKAEKHLSKSDLWNFYFHTEMERLYKHGEYASKKSN